MKIQPAEASYVSSREPIAIVGMACRFPKAANLDEFWDLLIQGKDTIDEIKRWDIESYFDSNKKAKDKTHQRHSSLFENVDDFDPLFFNISPAEAAEMTPSQKLLLELAWETIENSNNSPDLVVGSKTGVYIGNVWNDFEHLRKHRNAEITLHSSIGQSTNVIANRVSYFLGLTGPSLVVDTGCSTSLVALHLACQALWDGSVNSAFAGGINHILDPDQNLMLSKFGGLSAQGKCRTFDADADGFVRGEGAGLLLLKKLSDAEKDRDHIYAVVRGSAMNNNGFNINLPATSTEGQLDVLREAYEGSGIEPSSVHYVEAHGTGTKLGDPTECNALGQFFGVERTQPLVIGSVKTNVGHTEAAAGIAGLIKTVLAMRHKVLPKNLNFETPNPDIEFEKLKLKVPVENSTWSVREEGETMKAGVNSFGWGGTNAHVILEEYAQVRKLVDRPKELKKKLLLPLSAKNDQALIDYVRDYKALLETANEEEFENLVVATAVRKPKLNHSVLFAADDLREIKAQFDQFLVQPRIEDQEIESSKVVFVFPGQGSQWLGMGKELYEKEPIFKKIIDTCEQSFKPHTDWSLVDQLFVSKEQSRLNEISVIQPTLFAMQIALARLWMSFGVLPDTVVGHSMGEVASAHISGAIDLDDAAKIICTRSKLMQTVSGSGGAMAVTELSVREAEKYIKRFPRLSIAVNNSPKSTVLSGDENQIRQVLEVLELEGRFGKQVNVDVASHSVQMDPIKDDLGSELSELNPKPTSIGLFSTVRNTSIGGESLTAGYWVDNLRYGVKFAGVMEQLLEDGHNVFIEVSPHPVLTTAIDECLQSFNGRGITSSTLLRDQPEFEAFSNHLKVLYSKGLQIDWNDYYDRSELPYVKLPNYPFQRSTYVVSERDRQDAKPKGGHPIIGSKLKLASTSSHFWEFKIDIDRFNFLSDFKVDNKIGLSVSLCLEIVHAALAELTGNTLVNVSDLRLARQIAISDDSVMNIQLVVDENHKFELLADIGDQWKSCVEGHYTIPTTSLIEEIEEEPAPFSDKDPDEFYKQLERHGISYGSNFRNIRSLKMGSGHVSAYIDSLGEKLIHSDAYFIHPTLFESCLQLAYGAFDFDAKEGDRIILKHVSQIKYIKPHQADQPIEVLCKLITSDESKLVVDLIVTDSQKSPILILNRVELELSKSFKESPLNYQVFWRPEKFQLAKIGLESTTFVIEEQNDILDKLIDNVQSKGHRTNVVKMQSGYNWTEQINWQEIDQLMYFANSSFDQQEEQIELEFVSQLLRLFKSIEMVKPPIAPKITIITRAAVSLENAHINLNHTPGIGLSRVLANEFKKYNISLIDLPILPDVRDIELAAEIVMKPMENELQVAVRNNQLYLSRIEKARLTELSDDSFSGETIQVLVGRNSHTQTVIESMHEKGARNFTLFHDWTGEEKMKLNDNISIEYRQYTGKHPDELRSLFGDLSQGGNIESIIYFNDQHSSNLFRDYTLEDFNSVLKKITNEVLTMHDLAIQLGTDHFMLFSDSSSLAGPIKRSFSAAVGAFLDGIVKYRNTKGQPASSFHLSNENVPYTDELKTEEVTDSLFGCFSQSFVGRGMIKINPSSVDEWIPLANQNNYYNGLFDSQGTHSIQVLEEYHQLPDKEKPTLIKEFLHNLIADIIKSPKDLISFKMKFKHLGLDSLMAVQFRNRIEAELEIKLAISNIWSHPTINELAECLHYLLSEVGSSELATEDTGPVMLVDKLSEASVIQLVCFHDAGGSAMLFDDWISHLGERVEIIRIELPGRKGNASAKNQLEITKLIASIADRLVEMLDKPYMVFGHSMGGLFAFEVIHELKKRGFDLPKKLFVSSTPQLNSYNREEFDPRMTDEQMFQRFPYLNDSNTPDEELRNYLRSILRLDLWLLDSYEYAKKEQLLIDMIGIRGKDDHTVKRAQMEKWQHEIQGTLTLIERPGDHHYIKTDQDFVTHLILDELTSNELVKKT